MNNIKSLLIIILLFISLFFAYKWYFSPYDGDFNSKIKSLRQRNKILSERKDSLQLVLYQLNEEYDLINKRDSLLIFEINSLTNDITKSKIKVKKTLEELNLIKEELEKSKDKIKELQNILKSDSLLIESIKNRLN